MIHNDESRPELPALETRFRFDSGDIVLQHDVFVNIHAEHRQNVAGKWGGRVWFRTSRGEEVSVTLSYYREHAREIV